MGKKNTKENNDKIEKYRGKKLFKHEVEVLIELEGLSKNLLKQLRKDII